MSISWSLIRRKSASSVAVFGTLFSIVAFAAPVSFERLDRRDQAELIKWSQGSLGALVTSPIGSTSADVRATKRLIDQIVETLAGPELRRRSLHVATNIYAAVEPLAQAQSWGRSNTDRSTWDYAERNQNRPWPILALYGFSETDDVYEIRITTGMLNHMTTVEELAFIVARELTRIFEGHVGPIRLRDIPRVWWNSQHIEAVLDHGALKLMAGHYDLNGSVRALTWLSRPALEEQSGNEAALATSHQRGVRLSMLQLNVQHALENSTTNHILSRPLPQSARVGRTSQRSSRVADAALLSKLVQPFVQRTVRNVDFAWWDARDQKLCDELVALKNQIPENEFASGVYASALKDLYFENMKDALRNGNPSDRLSTALRVSILFSTIFRAPLGQLVEMQTLARRNELMYLVAAASKGQNIAESLTRLGRGDKNRARSMATELMSPGFQLILNPLMKWSPSWRGVTSFIFESLAVDRYRSPDEPANPRDRLELLLLLNEKKNPLSTTDRELVEEAIRQIDRTTTASLEFHFIFELQAQFHDEPGWNGRTRLRDALSRLEERLIVERDHDFRERIGRGKAEARLLGLAVARSAKFPLPEDIRDALFEKLARGNADESTFLVLANALSNTRYSVELRKTALRRLFFTPSNAFQTVSDLEFTQVAAQMRRFISEHAQDEMREWAMLQNGVHPVVLKILGSDPELRRTVIQHFTLPAGQELVKMRRALEASGNYSLDFEIANVWVDLLVATRPAADLNGSENWALSLSKLYELNPLVLDSQPEIKSLLRKRLIEIIAHPVVLNDPIAMLREIPLLEFVGARDAVDLLLKQFRKRSPTNEREAIAAKIKQFYQATRLGTVASTFERAFRTQLYAAISIQPNESHHFFPEEDSKLTQRTVRASTGLRGLSALVEEIQQRPAQEQLDAIRYILGNTANQPSFLSDALVRRRGSSTFRAGLDLIREQLLTGTETERIFAVNSVLAGPRGLMSQPHGIDILVDSLLTNIRANLRPLARELIISLSESYGESKTLPLALILAQKVNTKSDARASEAEMLRSLLVAHGAPGIKLGQYLAFTNSELRPYLSYLQDRVSDLSRLETVEAIEHHLGQSWLEHFELIRVIGSGSMNVAIKYKDRRTGEFRVKSLLYTNAQARTAENFRRITRALDRLCATNDGHLRYGYLRDLLPLIQDSTNLELNKQNAFQVQREANRIYSTTRRGWKIETSAVYSYTSTDVDMAEISGVSARELAERDPEHYRSALRALSEVEMSLLVGRVSKPVAAFANPDFHDGQFLIDVKNRRITILDFGQAVFLSTADRDVGIRLLRVIRRIDSQPSSVDWLNQTFRLASGAPGTFTTSDLSEILNSSEDMNRFVRLVARIRSRGGIVPIAVVHWVFAINRQLELSRRIGTNVKLEVAALVAASRLGIRSDTYSRVTSVLRPPVGLPAPRQCSDLFVRAR